MDGRLSCQPIQLSYHAAPPVENLRWTLSVEGGLHFAESHVNVVVLDKKPYDISSWQTCFGGALVPLHVPGPRNPASFFQDALGQCFADLTAYGQVRFAASPL